MLIEDFLNPVEEVSSTTIEFAVMTPKRADGKAVKDAEGRPVLTSRFKDAEGNPIKWKLRTLSYDEVKDITKRCFINVKDGKRYVDRQLDNLALSRALIARAMVYPDLHDARLQQRYGVISAEECLGKMVSLHEFNQIMKAYHEINSLEDEEETLDENIKN